MDSYHSERGGDIKDLLVRETMALVLVVQPLVMVDEPGAL